MLIVDTTPVIYSETRFYLLLSVVMICAITSQASASSWFVLLVVLLFHVILHVFDRTWRPRFRDYPPATIEREEGEDPPITCLLPNVPNALRNLVKIRLVGALSGV